MFFFAVFVQSTTVVKILDVVLFLMIWGREHAGGTTTSVFLPALVGMRRRRGSSG